MIDLEKPHRRFNPMTGEWVLVSPQRDRRPWLGKIDKASRFKLPSYDPNCYLCPGNLRVGGVQNPQYLGPLVFDNDFPALLPVLGAKEKAAGVQEHSIFQAEEVGGVCRVVCFSERHDLTLPQLSLEEAAAVVNCWAEQTSEISRLPGIRYVLIFENKGELMGCSNPHPHSQIWATSYVPDFPAKEMASQRVYRQKTGGCMVCDILQAELQDGERLIYENDYFAVLVPYWAVWPFETLLVCKQHIGSLAELDARSRRGLADIIQKMTTCYDNLFEISFPYSFGFHQSAVDPSPEEQLHLHAHFYPPLLRSADVKKFMVGFEMLAMPQRDLTPETAAARLKSLPYVHYLAR